MPPPQKKKKRTPILRNEGKRFFSKVKDDPHLDCYEKVKRLGEVVLSLQLVLHKKLLCSHGISRKLLTGCKVS